MKTFRITHALTAIPWGVAAVVLASVLVLPLGPAFGQGAGAEVKEPPTPPGIDLFDLNLGQTKAFSRSLNFKVVGHSYFKGPWLTPHAQTNGLGAGFNTPRVYNGIAYLAGYNGPPTLFGTLIADVSNPRNMQVLSFIPCNPGTRCPYLRVNTNRNILVGTHDSNGANPAGPPIGGAVAGVSFYDVSNPANPQSLGFYTSKLAGRTHGLEIDDRYAYICANTADSKPGPGGNQEILIIDYIDAANPVLASSIEIPGQHVGDDFGPLDQLNPNGTTPQLIQCHEITIHKDRLYVSWRDAGLVIVDVSDRSDPQIIGQLDYVPPFSGTTPGGFNLGAAHTSTPIIVDPAEHPDLVVQTDEIFGCPPGFGRIIDISDMKNQEVTNGDRDANLQIISNYRIPHVSDNYDFDEEEFVCPAGQQSIHHTWVDQRSPSLFYQAWYDQGVRAWDISNPFLPREVGYYLSPRYEGPGRIGRHTREVFQDPGTNLIYMTDGNGGGLTVLQWTGDIPDNPPIPGAR